MLIYTAQCTNFFLSRERNGGARPGNGYVVSKYLTLGGLYLSAQKIKESLYNTATEVNLILVELMLGELLMQWNLQHNKRDSTERLLIVHGSYNRTTSQGKSWLSLSSNRNKTRVIIAEGLAHTVDTYSIEVIARSVKDQLDLVSTIIYKLYANNNR